MNRVFVDMDGVLVDFAAYKARRGMTGDQVKKLPGAYLEMSAIPGSIEAVRSVIGMGFEVWIATKPPTGIAFAYADKVSWVLKHLPELKRRIVLTHDKGLLGDAEDVLCDDRPHKANCERFPGTLLRFEAGYHWPEALTHLRTIRPRRNPLPSRADADVSFQQMLEEIISLDMDPFRERMEWSDRRVAYKMGHADARHAAVTVAAEALKKLLADGGHSVALNRNPGEQNPLSALIRRVYDFGYNDARGCGAKLD